MEAATTISCDPNVNDLNPCNISPPLAGCEYGIQVAGRVYRALIVCDDVVEVERADKHLRSLGAEPETLTGPTLPVAIRRELIGESETTWWISRPIILTKEGFRGLRSDFGDCE